MKQHNAISFRFESGALHPGSQISWQAHALDRAREQEDQHDDRRRFGLHERAPSEWGRRDGEPAARRAPSGFA
ncbi:hypothetical protein [Burkholderia ubonensis]|uniref:hypothetical protein n=1 Tax=Burkholderia ubonensis TaxID=101571 RepID=UPI0012FC049F|nr:hypothetical protein [Burkholderia ubonensis]